MKPSLKDVSAGTASTAEPSELHLYTQCLVFSESTLARLDNHPLILLEVLRREGLFQLERVGLAGLPEVNISEKSIVKGLVHSLGRYNPPSASYDEFGFLLECKTAVVVYGQRHLLSWFQGLFDSLPSRSRKEMHFCTNLRFSPHRPFRITGISRSRSEANRIRRFYDLVLWNARQTPRPAETKNTSTDMDLVCVWHLLRESLKGDEKTYQQGRELWNDYRSRNSGPALDQARQSLLEWSVAAYRGLQNLQINQPRQINAMIDMLDTLLD